MEIDEHLFRRESGRITAALIKIFGVHNLDLAEDATQDAFCRALEVWKMRGIPANPPAWLMATAKNRALDILRRERTVRTFAPEYGRLLESEWTLASAVEELLEPNAIKDDQLRVMFSCCDRRLPETAQVALILHILCGFTVGEIASAFVSGNAAMEKRITRAKKVLASSSHLFDVSTQDEFAARLPSVHRALYLLFNEGYHGASTESAVRSELCREAMRLTAMLLAHPFGATPITSALAALMSLHAARLPTRINSLGDLTPLGDQDRARWDQALIGEGARLLEMSLSGSELSEYHIEAMIALIHAQAPSTAETDWNAIVALYDTLLSIHPSPVIALNRAIAVAEAEGPERGLDAIHAIADHDRLASYPFYYAAIAELELRLGNANIAEEVFRKARALARRRRRTAVPRSAD